MDVWLTNSDARRAFTGGGQAGSTAAHAIPATAIGFHRWSLAASIGTRDDRKRVRRIGAGSGNLPKTTIPAPRNQTRLTDVDLVSMPFEEFGSGPVLRLGGDTR